MDGAVFVDGRLFFLRPEVVEWAKSEAVAYRESFPCAEFRPESVRIYGWKGNEDEDDAGGPVLEVVGREIGKHWVGDEMGGLFGGEGRRLVEREMGLDWLLIGHRTPLPGWVFNSVMGRGR